MAAAMRETFRAIRGLLRRLRRKPSWSECQVAETEELWSREDEL